MIRKGDNLETKRMPTHFIAMNGASGCIPDSCSTHESFEDAVEYCNDLLELSDEQVEELKETQYVRCTDEQGADYAEISECACLKPWEHDEDLSPDDFPEYVKVHVQEFLNTLEKHEYQDQVMEHDPQLCGRLPSSPHFDCKVWVTRTFYCLPYASFGDYDNSTGVERSNARQFKEMFPFVSSHGVGYGEYTGIDETDVDAITWENLEQLKETCNALEDYPCIDNEDVSKVEMELQNEAWDSWACSDFRAELKKHFGADENETLEEQIDNLSSETLREMLETAADKANEYWEIEAGGSAHIRFERLLDHVVLPEVTQ